MNKNENAFKSFVNKLKLVTLFYNRITRSEVKIPNFYITLLDVVNHTPTTL